jgi:hypothetical protein
MRNSIPDTWRAIMTAAEANGTAQAGMVIVPGLVGKSFVPTEVLWRCSGGTTAGFTLQRVADEDNGVVVSHVLADCTSGAWVGRYGGTVVTTRLGLATATGKGLKFQPTGADMTGATQVDLVITGYYIDV